MAVVILYEYSRCAICLSKRIKFAGFSVLPCSVFGARMVEMVTIRCFRGEMFSSYGGKCGPYEQWLVCSRVKNLYASRAYLMLSGGSYRRALSAYRSFRESIPCRWHTPGAPVLRLGAG